MSAPIIQQASPVQLRATPETTRDLSRTLRNIVYVADCSWRIWLTSIYVWDTHRSTRATMPENMSAWRISSWFSSKSLIQFQRKIGRYDDRPCRSARSNELCGVRSVMAEYTYYDTGSFSGRKMVRHILYALTQTRWNFIILTKTFYRRVLGPWYSRSGSTLFSLRNQIMTYY